VNRRWLLALPDESTFPFVVRLKRASRTVAGEADGFPWR
jgi:hypothetical protein